VKRTVQRVVAVVGALLGRLQAEVVARRSAGAPLWVLDLDNTLADTWPSYLEDHAGERARLSGLVPLAGMIEATHGRARSEGARVVVLSHRAIWHWGVTRAWLRRNGIRLGWSELVLVASPADKVAHLRRWCAAGCRVTYWDDLTHGTERGRTERYDDVIAEVARLSLTHHGPDEIAAIVAAADPGRAERVAATLEAAGIRTLDR
jgi:hypothetical protein